MIATFLATFLGIATVIQLLYWLGIFSRLAFYREKREMEEPSIEQVPVSVIICARNEAENLKKNLPHIINQNYRSFEIIVVNDDSTDDTEKIILDFKKKCQILELVNVGKKMSAGKKAALKKGIEAARFDILILTDADCRPASTNWLYHMQKSFRPGKDIVLGYGPYEKAKSLLNTIIRFETLNTAIHYLSFSFVGLSYMGVGRNLAYRKSLYQRVGGFDRHAHIASGDDDLFINEAADGDNTTVSLQPDAWVYSIPKNTWRGYYNQKSRHLTTGSKYKLLHVLLLAGIPASLITHYVCGLMLLTYPDWVSFTILNYLVRIVVVSILYTVILKRFHEHILIPWIPFLDVLLVIYYLLFSPILLIGSKQRKWK